MSWNWRWVAVGAVGATLVALPALVPRAATGHSAASAASLLRMVQRSGSVVYSGYAESTGGLSLPVSSQFGSIADLLGGHTQLRAWWRGSRDWRVDTISLTGESDQHRNGEELWTWDYESNQATESVDTTGSDVRLPVAADLLPTTLARRLLSEATPAEVSRLSVRRIAGRNAVGLRLRPSESASTIDEVDVWVDPHSGAALRVDVHGAGTTVISTQFLDFSTARPPVGDTTFSPPATAKVRVTDDTDLAALIERLGLTDPPPTLAGIARNPDLPPVGSIGVYGHGVTEFAATPLFGRTARSLRNQLAKTAGVRTNGEGQALAVGPLTLVLTPPGTDRSGALPFGDGSWLLTGTVNQTTLVTAAHDLLASGQ